MVKATELRIGNLIHDSDLGIVLVETLRDDLINSYDLGTVDTCGENRYNPILLTEEWLLKFGFKDISYGLPVGVKAFEIRTSEYQSANFETRNDIVTWINDEGMPEIEIKTVHHLQNFIYAFYGKELECQL